MSPGPERTGQDLAARLEMLLEALGTPKSLAAAQALATGRLALQVEHGDHGSRIAGDVIEGARSFAVDVRWQLHASVRSLRDGIAGRTGAQRPGPVRLLLLLPDVRSIAASCSCGGGPVCRHALALLQVFARALALDPTLLWRNARMEVAPAAAQEAPEVPLQGTVSDDGLLPARDFWTYQPGPADDLKGLPRQEAEDLAVRPRREAQAFAARLWELRRLLSEQIVEVETR